MKGVTSNNVGVFTKDYNVYMAFKYWFIKYQNDISNTFLKYIIYWINIDVEATYDT